LQLKKKKIALQFDAKLSNFCFFVFVLLHKNSCECGRKNSVQMGLFAFLVISSSTFHSTTHFNALPVARLAAASMLALPCLALLAFLLIINHAGCFFFFFFFFFFW
jgi:hypothetical protein